MLLYGKYFVSNMSSKNKQKHNVYDGNRIQGKNVAVCDDRFCLDNYLKVLFYNVGKCN